MKNYWHLREARNAILEYAAGNNSVVPGRRPDVYHAASTASRTFRSPYNHEGFYRIINYSERMMRKSASTPGYNGSGVQKKDVENIISECENEMEMQRRLDFDGRGKPDEKYMDFCSDMKDDFMRIRREIEARQEVSEPAGSTLSV